MFPRQASRTIRVILFVGGIITGAGSLGPGGCRRGDESEIDGFADARTVVRTATDGPVTLTLSVSPAQVDFRKRADLRVEVLAPNGVTVELQDYARAVEEGEHRFEFRMIRAGRDLAVPTANGLLRWTDRCQVEFFLPGDYELPPARVSFFGMQTSGGATDGASGGASANETGNAGLQVRELSTEPLTIVAIDPAGQPLPPESLGEIATLDPIELPRPWSRWWWFGPLALVLLASVAVMVAIRIQRRRAARRAQPIPADEWAFRQIAALMAEDLLGKRLVQPFYYRISDIVRGYIERRFQVSAPEMTTDEFFEAVATDGRFAERDTTELQRFLTACDLVKYARHEPPADEPRGVAEAAKEFIHATCVRGPDETEQRDRPSTSAERAA